MNQGVGKKKPLLVLQAMMYLGLVYDYSPLATIL
jgi:hypothetical protein